MNGWSEFCGRRNVAELFLCLGGNPARLEFCLWCGVSQRRSVLPPFPHQPWALFLKSEFSKAGCDSETRRPCTLPKRRQGCNWRLDFGAIRERKAGLLIKYPHAKACGYVRHCSKSEIAKTRVASPPFGQRLTTLDFIATRGKLSCFVHHCRELFSNMKFIRRQWHKARQQYPSACVATQTLWQSEQANTRRQPYPSGKGWQLDFVAVKIGYMFKYSFIIILLIISLLSVTTFFSYPL